MKIYIYQKHIIIRFFYFFILFCFHWVYDVIFLNKFISCRWDYIYIYLRLNFYCNSLIFISFYRNYIINYLFCFRFFSYNRFSFPRSSWLLWISDLSNPFLTDFLERSQIIHDCICYNLLFLVSIFMI